MDICAVDWNKVWKDMKSRPYEADRVVDYWDSRAPVFAQESNTSPYVEQFMRLLSLEAGWRVLDVGCAAGTLALPLAPRVRQVTGIDISPAMLQGLRSACRRHGLDNVRAVNASWTDDWEAADIIPHEVAIASRSLIVPDLRAAIERLNRFATRRVYISTPVGDGPLDHAMFRAIGRSCRFGADYIYVYNLLYQMGLHASLNFITYRENKSYPDKETVFSAMQSRIGDLLPQEETALREYIDQFYVRREDRWRRAVPLVIRWAVMWWDCGEQDFR
jgi:SAM-dependent methyltransferase